MAVPVVQKAIRMIKKNYPEMYVVTDVCMCEYTCHGHCGILNETGEVENDTTLKYLGKIALSHAEAGADMVSFSRLSISLVDNLPRSILIKS